MTEAVTFRADGSIAEAVIDNPPVNATSAAVRAGLMDAIRRLHDDASLKALIIRCEGKTFVAGADIKEFGKPMASPLLPEVLAAMRQAKKPILAAVHGT